MRHTNDGEKCRLLVLYLQTSIEYADLIPVVTHVVTTWSVKEKDLNFELGMD